MYEFDSLSVSTYEASSLASKLTERSGDGWEVVAIVPTGSDVTAYLKRQSTSGGDDTSSASANEPAGWGTAPESSATGSSWGTSSTSDSGSSWGSGGPSSAGTSGDQTASWGTGTSTGDTSGGWGGGSTAGAAPAAPSSPAVPPGWYADPAGRYELRYWDGSAWTEHVSRAGQQYTDPPVA